KPCPLTRLFRIAIDCDICELVGVVLCGATALIVIVVPLERSRPRPTLNLSCQVPGFASALPMIVAIMTMINATSTPRFRHGWDVTPCWRAVPPPWREAPGLGEDPPAPPSGEPDRDDRLLGGATWACPLV